MGYGYLWWTLNAQAFGRGAALASGYGGQVVAIVPSKHLVVVQIVDPAQNAEGVRTSHFIKLLHQLAAAAHDIVFAVDLSRVRSRYNFFES